MRTRPKASRIGRLGLMAALLAPAGAARGQDAPGDFFREPVLVLAGGGHHAPVRSMVFARADGSQLLTGGMDKVIHAWDLDADRSRPSRTIRPPNWRGFRGQVNAMALSPVADADGRRLLAVAGYGVLSGYGEILLFRHPDPNGAGDVVGQLAATAPGTGHFSVVTSLAFTPDGRTLASASNDATVRLWDVEARRPAAVLGEATGPVNALAIFGRGTRLVAGGRDGTLRLYDIADRTRPRLMASASPNLSNPRDPFSGTIVALAAGPDGRSIVVGTEGGLLVRHDGANLAARLLPNAPTPGARSGPVEAVAIHPDGLRMAVSVIPRDLANPADFPTLSCVVEIRSVADGRVLERVATTSNLVQALAFSPDGRRLAFSGGDAQSVFVKELAPGVPPGPVEIPGQGSSTWDVGFRVDGQAVRFARSRPAAPGGAADYEAFHLRRRSLEDIEAGEPPYRHALASAAGWSIRPLDVTRLAFVDDRNRGWTGTLDPDNERRWYSFTVIPPDPAAGHPDPVAAVGTGTGIALWNLRTGRRTRFFNGHAGPVYSLASSPDGKWLLSGSSDQTVRLWPLAGCDRVPPFGARFERRADGAWVVAEVAPGGFAEGIKLRPGMVVERFFLGDRAGLREYRRDEFAAILPRLDEEPATSTYSFYARTGADPEPVRGINTKRDSPALSIYPSLAREWVMWTPRGLYDTSAAGDRKYLGWLTNRGTPGRLLAGRWDTIDKFEARFRQKKAPEPNALDQLLDTGDPIRAAAAAPAVAPEVAGPENSGLVRNALALVADAPAAGAPAAPPPIPGRPAAVDRPEVAIRYDIAADDRAAGIARASIAVDGLTVATLVDGPAVASAAGTVAIPLAGSRLPRVTLRTEDARGVVRTAGLTLSNQSPPDPARRPSRLEILAIGPDGFADGRLPAIKYAAADARDLAGFLRDRLIDPATGRRFPADRVRARVLDERAEVAAGPMAEALDDLKRGLADGRLAAGDVVALVVESHVFSMRSRQFLAAGDPEEGPVPASIPAAELADRLGELSRRGCRVVVLVDAVHDVEAPGWDGDIKEWIRGLQAKNNVAAFVATEGGASRPRKGQTWAAGHRAFAEGVLASADARSFARLRKAGEPLTVFDFAQAVTDLVLAGTGRKQHVQVYLPETIPVGAPFLDTSDLPPAPVSLKR